MIDCVELRLISRSQRYVHTYGNTQIRALRTPKMCLLPHESRNKDGLSVRIEIFFHIPFIRAYYGASAVRVLDIERPV